MNYQIQGFSIHAEVHGTAEPVLAYFSITGDPRLKLAEINGSLASSMAEIGADA